MQGYSPSQVAGILNYLFKPEKEFTAGHIVDDYGYHAGRKLYEADLQYLKEEVAKGHWPPKLNAKEIAKRLKDDGGILKPAEIVAKKKNKILTERNEKMTDEYLVYPYPTLQELGNKYGLTRERVRQIVACVCHIKKLAFRKEEKRKDLRKKHEQAPYLNLAETIQVDGRPLIEIISTLHKDNVFLDEVYVELKKVIAIDNDTLIKIYEAYQIPIYIKKTHVHCTHCGQPVKVIHCTSDTPFCQNKECQSERRRRFNRIYYRTYNKRPDRIDKFKAYQDKYMKKKHDEEIMKHLENGGTVYQCQICGRLSPSCDNPERLPYIGIVNHITHTHIKEGINFDKYQRNFGVPKPLTINDFPKLLEAKK